MKPPVQSVMVGDVCYTLRFATPDEMELFDSGGKPDFGRTLIFPQIILLNPTQGPDQLRDTIAHEIFHAILAQTPLAVIPLPEEDAEEALIRAFTPGWLGVLRRNPKLAAYLSA
jgi:hypothetical protein